MLAGRLAVPARGQQDDGANGEAGGTWESVICWCSSGGMGPQYGAACGVAAGDGAAGAEPAGRCGGYFTTIAGFHGQFSPGVLSQLQAGMLEGAQQVCTQAQGDPAPLECVPNLPVQAQLTEGQIAIESEPMSATHDSILVKGVALYILDTPFDAEIFTGQMNVPVGTTATLPEAVPQMGASCAAGADDGASYGLSVPVLAVTWAQGAASVVRPVPVLSCGGRGSVVTALEGLDQVAAALEPAAPAVVLLPFATTGGEGSRPLDAAASRLVEMGATVVAAAGNYGEDVSNFSPARASGVIAVGAEDGAGAMWADSNHGPGIALFAPGSASALAASSPGSSDRRLPIGSEVMMAQPPGGSPPTAAPVADPSFAAPPAAGTAYAAARAAGAAAWLLGRRPELRPEEVLQHLQDEVATQGMQTAGLRGSRNFLLAAPPSDAAPLPRLAVSADRLDPVLLYSNGSETQSVTLSNPSDRAADFRATPRIAGLFGGWLEISPSQGSLPAGGSVQLTMTYTAMGLWEGHYRATVEISSSQMTGKVTLDVELLNFCPQYGDEADPPLPLSVDVFEDEVRRFDAPPAWDATAASAPQGEEVMWLEGRVLELVSLDRSGPMCGEFAARLRAPVQAWDMSSTSVCLEFQEAAILANRSSTAFPPQRYCVLIQHKPRARLYAPGLAVTGDGLLTGAEEVTILVAFSKAMDEATLSPEDFVVTGPRGAKVSALTKVHVSGRFWHVLLRLGSGYYGPVRVGLRTSVSGRLGLPLAPVVPLEFSRERHALAVPTGYRILA
eukprot:jgi/Tetstr1/445504/TSEL_033280.t1